MPASATPMKPLKPGMGLYQVFYKPNDGPKGKPYGVFNLRTGSAEGRWHATKEGALAQARALYSTLGEKAKVHSEEAVTSAFFCFADASQVVDEGLQWVEAIEARTYSTPAYGDVEISETKITNFLTNFHEGVRGQDIAIDFEHGIDPAKGKKAAGWIRDAKSENGKLYLGIDFT